MNNELKQQFFTVTRLSKLLAMLLFILLPFVGLYIGYTFAPEKVVERKVEVSADALVSASTTIVSNENTDSELPLSLYLDELEVEGWDGKYPIMTGPADYRDKKIYIMRDTPGWLMYGWSGSDLYFEEVAGLLNTVGFKKVGNYLVNDYHVISLGFGTESLLMVEADPGTFEIISETLSKDKNHVYDMGYIIHGADGSEISMINFVQAGISTSYEGTVLVDQQNAFLPWLCNGPKPTGWTKVSRSDLQNATSTGCTWEVLSN